MPIPPAQVEYDMFADALKAAREEQEREAAGHDHGGGRPPLDAARGKLVTVYMRQDVLDWLKDQVALDLAPNVSQAMNRALRQYITEKGNLPS